MGLDVHGLAVAGIRVDRSAFWRADGTERRCEFGHASTGRFCSECGGRVRDVPREAPTELMLRIANGDNPRAVWDALREPRAGQIGIVRIDPIQTGEDDEQHTLAIGRVVAKTRSHQISDGKPAAVTIGELIDAATEIDAVARAWGIAGTVEVFAAAYLSN